MARTPGALNADFDETRRKLLESIKTALLTDQPPSSFRAMAEAAGVSIPTIRHYFGTREGVFEAVFASFRADGEENMRIAATPQGNLRQSIRQLLSYFLAGFKYGGLAGITSVGLIEGLSNRQIASAFLRDFLEPTIDAFEERLSTHIGRGEMRKVNARHAAIMLLSPILVSCLHQDALCGGDDYPLDMEALITDQVASFVRSFGLVEKKL